jgi:hypothetical protein
MLAEKAEPVLSHWIERIQQEALLTPRLVYGYFPCGRQGNGVVVYDPSAMAPGALAADAGPELGRFLLPRQRGGNRYCIADFYRDLAPGDAGNLTPTDVLPMQAVTMGERATAFAQRLFAADQYSDYLYFHGLAVQMAEALAEWIHARIRRELGFAVSEPKALRDVLAQRYRGVVATDITDDAVATAQLSRHLLEPEVRSRLSVLRADVGDTLRSQSFDLVAANAPWVPSSAAHGNVFADGGPSGSELPLRFLADGIRLLGPTGTLVLMCADLRFDDGRAPLHDALSHLRTLGFTTEIIATPKEYPFTFEDEEETSSLVGLRSAQHVTVVVYRQTQLRERDEPPTDDHSNTNLNAGH